jgi:hypothetical protein
VFTLCLASQQYKESSTTFRVLGFDSPLGSACGAWLWLWLVGWLDWTGLDWKEENVAFDVSRGRFCLDVFVFLCPRGSNYWAGNIKLFT